MLVTLVNHACVKVTFRDFAVLCDPWLEGSAFNDGWDLLIPSPMGVPSVMDGVRHIWMSHEHPDHFSPKFLTRIKDQYANRLTILFHETRDKRVKTFCESLGFRVVELPNRVAFALGNDVTANCGRHEFYDSWVFFSDGRNSLLNLNDCQVSKAEVRQIQKTVGYPDVLLTQFSYAAWKGGQSNTGYRAREAKLKLQGVATQIEALRPKWTVPFASLIYFSNQENAYLNDHINSPKDAAEAIAAAGSTPTILYPGDHWHVGEPHENGAALDRYAVVYRSLPLRPLRGAGESVTLEHLAILFEEYRTRIYAKNSRHWIKVLSRLPLIGLFRPLAIRLTDLDAVVRISLIDGFDLSDNGRPDVSMNSSSLAFIFKHEFGYDSLLVNGRFEAISEGFAKMSKSMGIGILNSMGLTISPRLLLNADIVWLAFSKFATVVSRFR